MLQTKRWRQERWTDEKPKTNQMKILFVMEEER